MSGPKSAHAVIVAGLAAFVAGTGGLTPGASADDNTWPASVAARYKLSFGGFEVGDYEFQSRFDGKSYQANSNARVSALFGAFTWKGNITSSGALDQAKPHPSAYQLSYKVKSKMVSITLGFDQDAIRTVRLIPDKKPGPEVVPVKDGDLKNVFDPMTAILAMTHASGESACGRTIPIFDGKARFNLVFSFKGEQKIADKTPTVQPAKLVVCKVKYQPVSGHKPKDFQNPWVDYDNMEIAFRPVPAAHIFVPYRVTIPTTIGAAVMMADKVTITDANKSEIALSQ
jgi:hypothetical protein